MNPLSAIVPSFPAALALAAGLLALPALAGIVPPNSLRLTGFSNGYAAMTTSLTGAEQVGVGRLAGVWTVNGVSNASFLTYCTDLFQDVYFNTTYLDYSLVGTDTAHGFSAHQADLLGKLYTRAGTIHNTNESVAFQLSVWEITNEDSPRLNVSLGRFKTGSGGTAAQLALANSWLVDIGQGTAANDYLATRLYSPSAQDFVVFNPRPTLRTGLRTAEPGSPALIAAALAAMAGMSTLASAGRAGRRPRQSR